MIPKKQNSIDIDHICMGLSDDKKSKMIKFVKEFERLEGIQGPVVIVDSLVKNLKKKGVTKTDIGWLIDILRVLGEVFEPRQGFVKRI